MVRELRDFNSIAAEQPSFVYAMAIKTPNHSIKAIARGLRLRSTSSIG